MSKIKSLFLGPNAENLELFQKLVDDIILDTAFLRRNYQPDDAPLITERDKANVEYINASAEARQYLKSVLGDLKKSVPTYHPRHIGHMNADVFMSGIAGFLGAMIYNPNNIINVASPTTTDMEVDYINKLCRMVGYEEISTKNTDNETGAWGHICSGGTSANIEALWVLRNLKYYPLTLKLVSNNIPFIGEITIASLNNKSINSCDYSELFNISVDDIYGLVSSATMAIENHIKQDKCLIGEALRNAVSTFYNANIKQYTVQNLGVVGIHQKIAELGKTLDLPIVFVSSTHHYSWEKAMDIIGLGNKQLLLLPTNQNFQLDIESLTRELEKNKPVLAVINIMGTTEEGAFDPLQEILKIKVQYNNAFFVHVDGAYGGYFASFPKEDGKSINSYITKVFEEEVGTSDGFAHSLETILKNHFSFDSEWKAKLNALRDADSITIDPHKLGYIPYPAGAILFKDFHSRQTIAFDAPYVSNKESQKSTEIYLGKWTMEGSRPGASAVACYLSGRLLPLDPDNHGKLLACTVISAARLFKAIENFNNNRKDGFRILPLFKTDSNCVCYIVVNPKLVNSPVLLNSFTKAVIDELTINPKTKIIPDYDFIISQSQWKYQEYKECIDSIMQEAGIEKSRYPEMEGGELQYIRSVMMNPLSAYEPVSFFDGYFNRIGQIVNKALVKVFAGLILQHNNGKRMPLLWIENDETMVRQKDQIETDSQIGHALDIDFLSYNQENINNLDAIFKNNYSIVIVDLNLTDENHREYSIGKTTACMRLIREIRKKNSEITIFVCSEYLSDSNPNKNDVVQDLFDPDQELGITECALIAKERLNDDEMDFERNKLNIIHAIFNYLQDMK